MKIQVIYLLAFMLGSSHAADLPTDLDPTSPNFLG
jgi:hypothetical protein